MLALHFKPSRSALHFFYVCLSTFACWVSFFLACLVSTGLQLNLCLGMCLCPLNLCTLKFALLSFLMLFTAYSASFSTPLFNLFSNPLYFQSLLQALLLLPCFGCCVENLSPLGLSVCVWPLFKMGVRGESAPLLSLLFSLSTCVGVWLLSNMGVSGESENRPGFCSPTGEALPGCVGVTCVWVCI